MSDNKGGDQPLDEAERGQVPVRPLRGFATLNGDVDEFLPRMRAEQAELARRKIAEIFDEPGSSDL